VESREQIKMWSAAIRGFALTFTTDSNFVIRFKLET